MKKETKNTITDALEAYLQQHNMSANSFCAKSGINASTLSAIRAKKDFINAGNDKEVIIADKYYVILAEHIGYKLEKTYWEVVPTPQMSRILATLEDAKEFGDTNVIIGATGCGKTFISGLFVNEHPNDCFIIKVGSTDNISDLLDKIIDTLKIPTAKTKSKKLRAIMQYLKSLKLNGHKPMIIFDEAEYMKQPALCSMKELYDNLKGTCAIILVGTDQLVQSLDKLRKKNKEGIPQLYRRIKFGIRILQPIDKSFKDFLKGISDKGLVKFLCANCENYGELHDVLVPAMREAERLGEELTEKFVRTMFNFPVL